MAETAAQTQARYLKHCENFNECFKTTATRAVVILSQRRPAASVGNNFLTELKMQNLVTRFGEDESGVTAIEYGLIAALISVVCIAAMTFAGQQLLVVYNRIGNSLANALG
jgi:pilus assembly protein Flp/PilA